MPVRPHTSCLLHVLAAAGQPKCLVRWPLVLFQCLPAGRKEYEKFMKAETHKDRWERAGLISAVIAAVSAGLAAFGKAHENAGGVAQDPSAARLVKGAGTSALITGAGALIAWLNRRQSKKRQKLHNARLTRMQFEARTGLKPSDQNVLGPEEDEILNPKKKDKKKDED